MFGTSQAQLGNTLGRMSRQFRAKPETLSMSGCSENQQGACPGSDDGGLDHFRILEQSEAAAEKKNHDKQEFKCGALASVNCNSQ
jgi:hypothetical protein